MALEQGGAAAVTSSPPTIYYTTSEGSQYLITTDGHLLLATEADLHPDQWHEEWAYGIQSSRLPGAVPEFSRRDVYRPDMTVTLDFYKHPCALYLL